MRFLLSVECSVSVQWCWEGIGLRCEQKCLTYCVALCVHACTRVCEHVCIPAVACASACSLCRCVGLSLNLKHTKEKIFPAFSPLTLPNLSSLLSCYPTFLPSFLPFSLASNQCSYICPCWRTPSPSILLCLHLSSIFGDLFQASCLPLSPTSYNPFPCTAYLLPLFSEMKPLSYFCLFTSILLMHVIVDVLNVRCQVF